MIRFTRERGGTLRYDNPAADLHARIWRVDTLGYAWQVTQWGRVLGHAVADKQRLARAEVESWIETVEEVTPVE
jgi:hypothetical protein